MTKSDLQTLISFWLEGSKRDKTSAKVLAKAKCYAQALFFEHLSLEKKAEALCVKKLKTHAPYGHNLAYLFGKINVDLDAQQLDLLEKVTAFNIKGRYPNEKEEFYKLANKRYYEKWQKVCQEFHSVLDEML